MIYRIGDIDFQMGDEHQSSKPYIKLEPDTDASTQASNHHPSPTPSSRQPVRAMSINYCIHENNAWSQFYWKWIVFFYFLTEDTAQPSFQTSSSRRHEEQKQSIDRQERTPRSHILVCMRETVFMNYVNISFVLFNKHETHIRLLFTERTAFDRQTHVRVKCRSRNHHRSRSPMLFKHGIVYFPLWY